MTLTVENWNTITQPKTVPLWVTEFGQAKVKAICCDPADKKLQSLFDAIERELIRLAGIADANKSDTKRRQKVIDVVNTLNGKMKSNEFILSTFQKKPTVGDHPVYIFLRNACLNLGNLRIALGWGLFNDTSLKNIESEISKIDRITLSAVSTTNKTSARVAVISGDDVDQEIIDEVAAEIAERTDSVKRSAKNVDIKLESKTIAQIIATIEARGYEVRPVTVAQGWMFSCLICSQARKELDPEMIVAAAVSATNTIQQQVASVEVAITPKRYHDFQTGHVLIDSKSISPAKLFESFSSLTYRNGYVVEVDPECKAYCRFGRDGAITFLPDSAAAKKFTVPLPDDAGFSPVVFKVFNRKLAACYPSKIVFISLETQQVDTFYVFADNYGNAVVDAKDEKRESLQCRSHSVSPDGKNLIFIVSNYAYCLNLESNPFQPLRQLKEMNGEDSLVLFRTDDQIAVAERTSFDAPVFSLEIYKLNSPYNSIGTIKSVKFGDKKNCQHWNASFSPNGKIFTVICSSLAEGDLHVLFFYNMAKPTEAFYSCKSSGKNLHLEWVGNDCLINTEKSYEHLALQPIGKFEEQDKSIVRDSSIKYVKRQDGRVERITLYNKIVLCETYIPRQQLAEQQTQLLVVLSYLLSSPFVDSSKLIKDCILLIAEYTDHPAIFRRVSATVLCASMLPALGVGKISSASSTPLFAVSSSADKDSKDGAPQPIASASSSSNSSVRRELKV